MSFRLLRLVFPSRIRQLAGVGLALALPAAPAWAALPEAFASPVVTICAGLAAMLGTGGGIYLMLLRRRLVACEAELAALRAAPVVQPTAGAPLAPLPAEGISRHFQRAVADGLNLEGWVDREGRFFWVSQVIERYTGRSAAEVLAGDFVDLVVYERDRSYCRDQIRRALADEQISEFELRLISGNRGVQWISCHWQPIRDGEGLLLGLRVTMSDVQARKEAEFKLLETVAALRRAQALSEHYLRRSNEERSRLSALLDVVRMGILFMDTDRRVVYCNRALYEIWRMNDGDGFVGVRDVVLQQHVLQFVADPVAFMEHVNHVLSHRMPSEPYEILFSDGRVVTDFSRVVPGPDGGRSLGRIWVFEDVTEQRRVARQLLHMAERDPLTNLYNRRRFHEELARMLADSSRHRECVGLLAIDLDGFKPVNDRFGHQAGDEVLVDLASELGSVVRRNEMFFRLGGDEFAILVPSASASELSELARRLCACIAGMSFNFNNQPAGVTASIGIALSARDGDNPESLIGAADRAMYLAKALGGNCWEFARESVGETVA